MCHPQPKPPAPPAWAMMPPSNSLQLLDETFSVSGTELPESEVAGPCR
ncbi:lysis system o-spanin lipoprotein Rz1 [Escherichia coli]